MRSKSIAILSASASLAMMTSLLVVDDPLPAPRRSVVHDEVDLKFSPYVAKKIKMRRRKKAQRLNRQAKRAMRT